MHQIVGVSGSALDQFQALATQRDVEAVVKRPRRHHRLTHVALRACRHVYVGDDLLDRVLKGLRAFRVVAVVVAVDDPAHRLRRARGDLPLQPFAHFAADRIDDDEALGRDGEDAKVLIVLVVKDVWRDFADRSLGRLVLPSLAALTATSALRGHTGRRA